MQKFLHCMFEITLGVKNTHIIEIAYVNDNDVASNIYSKNKRITQERKYLYKHISRNY